MLGKTVSLFMHHHPDWCIAFKRMKRTIVGPRGQKWLVPLAVKTNGVGQRDDRHLFPGEIPRTDQILDVACRLVGNPIIDPFRGLVRIRQVEPR